MNIGHTEKPTRELTEDEQFAIDDAIEKAVDRAYPIFDLFGWTWADSRQTPTRERMRDTLERLVESVLRNEEYTMSGTGRFSVYRHDEDGVVSISIELDLSEVHVIL
jgi:hypothetical protein